MENKFLLGRIFLNTKNEITFLGGNFQNVIIKSQTGSSK